MRYWAAEITVDASLFSLLEHLVRGTSYMFAVHDSKPVIRSKQNQSDIEPKTGEDALFRFISQLNALLIVGYDFDQKVEIKQTYLIDSFGRKNYFAFTDTRHIVQAAVNRFLQFTQSPDAALNADPYMKVMQLTEHNQRVSVALEAYSYTDSSWPELFVAYEAVVCDMAGTNEIVDQGWATENELKRFRYTSQCSSVLGAQGRHYNESFTPPPEPMSKHDAEVLIRKLIANWLEYKIAHPST